VLSSACYAQGPDVLLGLITSRSPAAPRLTDCAITRWRSAGLHAPSWFRLYVVTMLRSDVRPIGRLAEEEWEAVRRCVKAGLGGLE
jgi:hypothetical protein